MPKKVLENKMLGLKVGAYRLPNRKKIALCTENKNGCIEVHGYFNSVDDANAFMNTLVYMVGAKMDKEETT